MAGNAQVGVWQGELLIGKEAVYGTLVLGNLNGWQVIGQPDVDTMPEWLDTGATGSGTSERRQTEFAVGKKQAAIVWDGRGGNQKVYHSLRSMSQAEAVKTGAGPYVFTWDSTSPTKFPWVMQPATNIGYSVLAMQLDGLASGTFQFLGAICEGFSLESEEGGWVKMHNMWRGTTATQTSTSGVTTLLAGTEWSHYNIAATVGGASISPAKWKVEFTNNMLKYWGTSQVPTDLALGAFGMKGAFTLPLKTALAEYTKAQNRTSTVVVCDYGSHGLNGNFYFTCDAVYSAAKIVDYNGLKCVDFEWTQAKNATTTQASVADTVDLSA